MGSSRWLFYGAVGLGSAAVAVAGAARPALWSAPAAGTPGLGSALPRVLPLEVWCGALAVLGLADLRTLGVPRRLWRACAAVAFGAMALGCGVTGSWFALAHGVEAATVSGLGYAAWAVARPAAIGGADVRMVWLVAFGAGTVAPGTAVAAVWCASAVAAIWQRTGPGRSGRQHRAPVALCPFLALAGLAGVVVGAL